jgi:hypothetical protein
VDSIPSTWAGSARLAGHRPPRRHPRIINRLAGSQVLDLCAAACETAAPDTIAAEGG